MVGSVHIDLFMSSAFKVEEWTLPDFDHEKIILSEENPKTFLDCYIHTLKTNLSEQSLKHLPKNENCRHLILKKLLIKIGCNELIEKYIKPDYSLRGFICIETSDLEHLPALSNRFGDYADPDLVYHAIRFGDDGVISTLIKGKKLLLLQSRALYNSILDGWDIVKDGISIQRLDNLCLLINNGLAKETVNLLLSRLWNNGLFRILKYLLMEEIPMEQYHHPIMMNALSTEDHRVIRYLLSKNMHMENLDYLKYKKVLMAALG